MFPIYFYSRCFGESTIVGVEGDLELKGGTNGDIYKESTEGAEELLGLRSTTKCKQTSSDFADTLFHRMYSSHQHYTFRQGSRNKVPFLKNVENSLFPYIRNIK